MKEQRLINANTTDDGRAVKPSNTSHDKNDHPSDENDVSSQLIDLIEPEINWHSKVVYYG